MAEKLGEAGIVHVLQQNLLHQKGNNVVVARPVVEEIITLLREKRPGHFDLPSLLELVGQGDTLVLSETETSVPARAPKPQRRDVEVDKRYMIIDDKAFTGMLSQAEEERATYLAQLEKKGEKK